MKSRVIVGLLLKDWYTVRTYLVRQIGLLVLIYLIISLVLKEGSMLVSMVLLGGMMGFLTLFSMDDACRWNGFAVLLNLRPSQLVAARYLAVYGGMAAVTVLAAALGAGMEFFVLGPLFGVPDAGENALAGLITGLAVFLCYALVLAVDMPLYYKLGVERARIPTTLTMVVPFVAIVTTAPLWGPALEGLAPSALPWGPLLLAAVLLPAAAIALSAAVSVRILAAKEF